MLRRRKKNNGQQRARITAGRTLYPGLAGWAAFFSFSLYRSATCSTAHFMAWRRMSAVRTWFPFPFPPTLSARALSKCCKRSEGDGSTRNRGTGGGPTETILRVNWLKSECEESDYGYFHLMQLLICTRCNSGAVCINFSSEKASITLWVENPLKARLNSCLP